MMGQAGPGAESGVGPAAPAATQAAPAAAEPAEHTEPAEPARPAEHTESAEPQRPAEPAEAAEPAEHTEPAEPARPAGARPAAPLATQIQAKEPAEAAERAGAQSEPGTELPVAVSAPAAPAGSVVAATGGSAAGQAVPKPLARKSPPVKPPPAPLKQSKGSSAGESQPCADIPVGESPPVKPRPLPKPPVQLSKGSSQAPFSEIPDSLLNVDIFADMKGLQASSDSALVPVPRNRPRVSQVDRKMFNSPTSYGVFFPNTSRHTGTLSPLTSRLSPLSLGGIAVQGLVSRHQVII